MGQGSKSLGCEGGLIVEQGEYSITFRSANTVVVRRKRQNPYTVSRAVRFTLGWSLRLRDLG
jgi:hypothetical protein